MDIVNISDEYIKLGQLLKLAGYVDSGLEAKIRIKNGEVKVNGVTVTERGKKIFNNDVVEYGVYKVKVKSDDN